MISTQPLYPIPVYAGIQNDVVYVKATQVPEMCFSWLHPKCTYESNVFASFDQDFYDLQYITSFKAPEMDNTILPGVEFNFIPSFKTSEDNGTFQKLIF